MQDFTDSDLLRMLSLNNERRIEALEELHQRWHLRIHAYFFSKVRSATEANDLAQQFYVRLMSKRRALARTITNAEAYIFGIARNLAVDYFKEEERHHPRAEKKTQTVVKDRDCIEHPTAFHYDNQFIAIARVALRELSLEEQEILVLRKHCALPSKIVAGFYGKSVGAIDNSLARAYRKWQTITGELLRKMANDQLPQKWMIKIEQETDLIRGDLIDDKIDPERTEIKKSIRDFLDRRDMQANRAAVLQYLAQDGVLCAEVAQELVDRYNDEERRMYALYFALSSDDSLKFIRSYPFHRLQQPSHINLCKRISAAITLSLLLCIAGILVSRIPFSESISNSRVSSPIKNISSRLSPWSTSPIYDSNSTSLRIHNSEVDMKNGITRLAMAAVLLSSAAFSQGCKDDVNNPGTDVPTQGLIASYPMNGNANDVSGNNHHGTLINASPTRDRFGEENRAYRLPDNSASITTTFPGISGKAPRTLSFWARRNIDSQGHFIAVGYGHIRKTPEVAGSAFFCYLYFDDSLTIGIDVQQGAIRYDAPADDTNWHHYAYIVPNQATVRLKDIRIYQDGIAITNGVDWWTDQATSENVVVETLPSEDLSMETRSNGEIDDVRFYNRALSDQEILQLYHENGYQ